MPLSQLHLDDAARARALGDRDAVAYVRLCDAQGIRPEDDFLYEQGLAERVAKAHFTTLAPSVPPQFGIRRSDIERFGYPVLESLFHGMHAIALAPEVMERMNPDEILAKYYGAADFRHRNQPVTTNSFSTLMKLLDGLAYRSPGFRSGVRGVQRRFSAKPGEQQKRLADIEQRVKQEVVASFFSPVPKYYNPNCDGRDREVYIDSLFRRLKETHETYTTLTPASSF
ncbi:MAG: hypothetical protein Q7R76_03995 [Candidatus Woesearchaeota archaeon]|nr:hypothetical protein [Candidatus Woesearchaeota archaeon]